MLGAIIPIGVGGLVVFGLWFWAVLDCIATDSILVRNLPKATWIVIVVFVPTVGAMAWLLLGRPEGAGFSVGGTYRPPDYTQNYNSNPGDRRVRGPKVRGIEDSSGWESTSTPSPREIGESDAVKERRLLEWEAELERREAALDDEPPGSEATDE